MISHFESNGRDMLMGDVNVAEGDYRRFGMIG